MAKLIKKARIESGLTQAEVADSLGYTSAQFVSNWERSLASPPMHTFRKLSKLLGVSASQLRRVYLKDCADKFDGTVG